MTPVNIESFGENCPPSSVKDPRWLQVEVCREFQRGKCTRSGAECRFAHPNETVQVESGGKVTACFDSMKDRCQRESCKYFHPPHHIKLQLEANGRLLKQHRQQLQALASQHMIQTPATVLPLPAVNTLGAGVNAFPVTFVSSPVLTTSPHSVPVATTNSNWRTEKVLPFLEVCQDYIKGICSLSESQCSSAHPALDLLRDGSQKRITVCMDFVKGRCTREACRYFHPPTHLQGKLKTVKISQSQVSLIPASSRKRPGESKDDLEEQKKQQALNYTLINTPLTLPANFTTFVQPSGFQHAANAMQFAPAFFSTVPFTVPQFTTTAAAPYLHPQVPQDYNYILADPGVFYGYQSAMPYYPNGCQYIVPCEQQLSALNTNYKHIQLPICRDYKSGNCRRDSCRYIHLDNRNVEVIDGKVTVCLDAAKGKCQRTECKYYHVPST